MSDLKLEKIEKKKCFNCQVELKLEEILERNKDDWPEWFLRSAFKGNLVQMYCCSCFNAKAKGETALKDFKVKFEAVPDYDYDDEWMECDDYDDYEED